MMPKADRDARIEALTKLALVTKEFPPPKTTFEKESQQKFLLIYLEDTAMFATSVVVEACHRLRLRMNWFPKGAELRDECRIVAQQEQERLDSQRRRIAAPRDQVSDARLANIRQDVDRMLATLSGKKGM